VLHDGAPFQGDWPIRDAHPPKGKAKTGLAQVHPALHHSALLLKALVDQDTLHGESSCPLVKQGRIKVGKPTSGTSSEDWKLGELSLDSPNYFAAAGTNSLLLGVIDHPADVDDHHRLIADNPSIMPRRKRRYFARPEFVLRAIVHHYVYPSRHMVL